MSLAQLVRSYRQRRITISLGAGLGAAAALGSTFLMPTLYESTTQLFVTTTARTADGQLAPDAGSASDRVRSYARLATSEEVLKQVITDLKLPITTADLATRIRASNEPGTVLIDVRARDQVAANARDIAQKVGEHLPIVVQKLETPSDGNDAVTEGPEVTPAPITVRVTSKAVLAHDPVSPNRLLAMLYGLLGGAVLVLLALTWQELFDRKLRSRAEVSERTGIPVLAEIPENSPALASFTGEEASTAHTEAFRRLRSHLSHAPAGRSLGNLVVTSAVSGEGRTATACNLALALAHGGLDVVLIDADLRSPAVASMLNLTEGAGLSSLLTGSASLAQAMRQWSPGIGLRVITAGPGVANPGDLLGSPRMASLVAALGDHGLTVIIDSPPLTTVADGATLARLADGALLVVRCGKTTAAQVGAAVDELRHLGTPLFGIALNRTPAPRGAKTVGAAVVAKPRRAARGKTAVPVQIPYGSSLGHAAEGFPESAPPPTRAAPPDSLAAAVADLLGQSAPAARPTIAEVSSPEAIAAAISATASAGGAAAVLAGTAAAPFGTPLAAPVGAPLGAPSGASLGAPSGAPLG
ncbi:MAG: polysaccharide biosynthesis tyrosine autokinase, partial [Kineosporiaceae bacterium]